MPLLNVNKKGNKIVSVRALYIKGYLLGYLLPKTSLIVHTVCNRLWLKQSCFSSSLHWGRMVNFNYHIDFHYGFNLWDHMQGFLRLNAIGTWVSSTPLLFYFSFVLLFLFQFSKFISSSICNWNGSSIFFQMNKLELPFCCNSKEIGTKDALLFQLTYIIKIF